jgi:hypothetical protein
MGFRAHHFATHKLNGTVDIHLRVYIDLHVGMRCVRRVGSVVLWRHCVGMRTKETVLD